MTDIQYRKFQKDDAEEVSALLRRVFLEYNAGTASQEGVDFFLNTYSPENIQEKWPEDCVVLAERGGDIVGVGRAKSNGWITHVYVDSESMRRGTGEELMRRLEDWLKSIGATKVRLNTSLFAADFYQSLGYKKQTDHPKEEHGIPMFAMQKNI